MKSICVSVSVCLLIINRQIEVTDVTFLVTEARNNNEILTSGICSQRFYKTHSRKNNLNEEKCNYRENYWVLCTVSFHP